MTFRKIMLVTIAFAIAFSLCACSAEEPDSYYLEMTISFDDNSPAVHIKTDEELTEPISLGLDTKPHMGFYAHVDLINSTTGEKEFSFLGQPDQGGQIGFKMNGYLVDSEGDPILDSAGNKIVCMKREIKDPIYSWFDNIYMGYRCVSRRAGIYKMEATVPALPRYGLKASSFRFFVSIEEDTREDAVEIVMNDSESYEKIEFEPFGYRGECYDITCKEPPKFIARDKSSGEILPDAALSTTFREIDDLYFSDVPQYSSDLNTASGIYICLVHYDGTEQYRAVNYYCYLIY